MTRRYSRLNSRELNAIRKFIISRDGNKCNNCDEEPIKGKLVVDHIDNNFLNNEPGNLRLICQSCNIRKNPPYSKKTDVDNFSLSLSFPDFEVDDDYLSSASDITLDNYPIWKNLRSEPMFQVWLKKEMTKKLSMDIKQVLNDGANIAKCSSKTTSSYLEKLVYETGPYKIEKDSETGARILCWKEKFFPFNFEFNKWAK